jgi:hypothetical protein
LPVRIWIEDAKNRSNQTFANRVNGNRLWAPSVAAGAIEETITPNKKIWDRPEWTIPNILWLSCCAL